jgi:hypothetical protein
MSVKSVGIGPSARPKVAPSRRIEPLWLHLGDVFADYQDWWFCVRPTSPIRKLNDIVVPLSRLQQLGQRSVTSDDPSSVETYVSDMSSSASHLCAGLAEILLDWNFADEVSGKALAKPNPLSVAQTKEQILNLDMRIIMGMGALVSTYLSGTPPNVSETTSDSSIEPTTTS